jgi:hypothetical protein
MTLRNEGTVSTLAAGKQSQQQINMVRFAIVAENETEPLMGLTYRKVAASI